MHLLFFIFLMIIIGIIINYIFDTYFHECKECNRRQNDESLEKSIDSNQSVDDCMEELMAS
jgi:uncharacterized BrkB/YihY/UPF0761 family membrane protein